MHITLCAVCTRMACIHSVECVRYVRGMCVSKEYVRVRCMSVLRMYALAISDMYVCPYVLNNTYVVFSDVHINGNLSVRVRRYLCTYVGMYV
jgi:hypothetical protein